MKRGQPSFIEISTAETGSIQLEFRDLSRSSNDSRYEVDSLSFTLFYCINNGRNICFVIIIHRVSIKNVPLLFSE